MDKFSFLALVLERVTSRMGRGKGAAKEKDGGIRLCSIENVGLLQVTASVFSDGIQLCIAHS